MSWNDKKTLTEALESADFRNDFGEKLQESPLWPKFVKVNALLCSKDKVSVHLQSLDDEMTAIVMERLKITLADKAKAAGKTGIDNRLNELIKFGMADTPGTYPMKRTRNFSHLMSQALRNEEIKGGFPDSIAQLWGGTSETFLSNLRQRRHFKDYGAATTHGEYTHRLQWYVVSRGVFHSKSACADYYENVSYWKNKDYYLWDFLFDRGSNTISAEDDLDFRSPIKLLAWLMVQSAELPLLSSFLAARSFKRRLGGGGTNAERAAGLKLFHKLWGNLTPIQKLHCQKLINQGIEVKNKVVNQIALEDDVTISPPGVIANLFYKVLEKFEGGEEN